MHLALVLAVSAADKITDFALSKIQSVLDTTTKLLPTVTKYVMGVTSMNCLFSILSYFSLLIIGFVVIRTARLWLRLDTDSDGNPLPWSRNDFTPGFVVQYGIGCILLGFFIIAMFSSIWEFVCVVHPDLYLVHKAVEKVVK